MTGTGDERPLRLAGAGALALAAALGIGRFVYTPILPAMAGDLGLDATAAGLIASANFVGYLAGALAAALPRLPGSRRTWLVAALATSAATTAAMGLVSSTAALAVLRLVGGASSAVALVYASTLVLDRLAAAGRGGLAALHFAGVGGGIALSALLVSLLSGAGATWRGTWLASGALALLTGIASVVLLPRGEPPGPTPAPALVPAGDRRGGLVLAYGLFGFGYVVTATFLVAIVRGEPDLGPLEPWIWGLVGLAAIPSVALWAAVGRRIGLRPAFALAAATEAVGVAASVVMPSGAGLALAGLLLGGTFMGLTALGIMAARQDAAAPPRAVAVMTASFGVGQILGPGFAGLLHGWTGSFMAPSLAAAAALLLAATLVLRSAPTLPTQP